MAKKAGFPTISKEKVESLPFGKFITLSILVNIFIIVASFLINGFMPPQIPLFYGLPQSELQLASSWLLFLPSAISLLIIIFNIVLSFNIENEFLKKTLLLSSIAVTFFSAITTLKIIFLVGSF